MSTGIMVTCWNGPCDGDIFYVEREHVEFGRMIVVNGHQYVFDRVTERGITRDVLLWKESSPGLASGHPDDDRG